MKAIQKIIVPVDFSTGSSKLVDYYIYMAEKLSAAEERMQNLLKDNGDRLKDLGGKVVQGDAAEAEKADLIVIGTHGTKGLEKLLLGSVAERVIRKAPCPTLMYNLYK